MPPSSLVLVRSGVQQRLRRRDLHLDQVRLGRLRLRQRDRQHAEVAGRLDLVRIDRGRQPERPLEGAVGPLIAMDLVGLLLRHLLLRALDRQQVALHRDLHVLGPHSRHLRHQADDIGLLEDVHQRQPGRGHGLGYGPFSRAEGLVEGPANPVLQVMLHRLEELGLEQQALARAANVTESYISQLLTRRKAPPAPNRTDIYDRMDKFLKLPSGELAKLADLQRKEELKRELGDEPAPLFHEVRELILRKCNPERQKHVRAIFETQPFGELERLVTQTLLDVVKRVAKDELENDYWLRMVARLSRRSYEEMRVVVLEFLDTDIFHVSAENCVA